jgi:hypothetical protein
VITRFAKRRLKARIDYPEEGSEISLLLSKKLKEEVLKIGLLNMFD